MTFQTVIGSKYDNNTTYYNYCYFVLFFQVFVFRVISNSLLCIVAGVDNLS